MKLLKNVANSECKYLTLVSSLPWMYSATICKMSSVSAWKFVKLLIWDGILQNCTILKKLGKEWMTFHCIMAVLVMHESGILFWSALFGRTAENWMQCSWTGENWCSWTDWTFSNIFKILPRSLILKQALSCEHKHSQKWLLQDCLQLGQSYFACNGSAFFFLCNFGARAWYLSSSHEAQS